MSTPDDMPEKRVKHTDFGRDGEEIARIETPTMRGQKIAARLRSIVLHRGYLAERQLIKHFGARDLALFYAGVEPNYVELVMMAEMLKVSLWSILPKARDLDEELQLVIAEIAEYARRAPEVDQDLLKRTLRRLVRDPLIEQQFPLFQPRIVEDDEHE